MRKELKQWLDSAANMSAGLMPLGVHLSGPGQLREAEIYAKGKKKFKQISFIIPDNFTEDCDDDLL